MRNLSKTSTTLTRLRHHYPEDRDDMVPTMSAPPVSGQSTRTTPFPTVDVVGFHPDEIVDLTPLRPEEADENQLAEILQGDDLSFLLEKSAVTNRKRKQESEIQMHRIPNTSVAEDTQNEHKRRRVSNP
eukprot:scaffold1530_cov98-Cylindrotheca_fusiformis.AAC.4